SGSATDACVYVERVGGRVQRVAFRRYGMALDCDTVGTNNARGGVGPPAFGDDRDVMATPRQRARQLPDVTLESAHLVLERVVGDHQDLHRGGGSLVSGRP